MRHPAPATIAAYISSCPREVRPVLQKIRQAIRATAPQAVETISYGMPAFKLRGKILVYFAAWKNHIGFYALPTTNVVFKKELASYKTSKGAVQFPLDWPIPYALIKKMVRFRVRELLRI